MTPPAGVWRQLQIDRDVAPPLIYKGQFDGEGYHIQISDMSRVWKESLNKETIVTRASDSGCSIDAAEDDQYSILTEKIESALNGVAGTSLEVKRAGNSQDLTLDVTAPLPASLPTFRWTVHLSLLPTQSIAAEIVNPLLHQAKSAHDQVEHLVKQLKAKDHVISKITAEMEKMGHDLAQVFPATTAIRMNKKITQREQLASRIPGLGIFDESTWKSSLNQNAELWVMSSETICNLVQSASSFDEHLHDPSQTWLHYLDNSPTTATKQCPANNSKTQSLDEPTGSTSTKKGDAERLQHRDPLPNPGSSHPSTLSTNNEELNARTEDHQFQVSGQAEDEDESTEDDDDDKLDLPPGGESLDRVAPSHTNAHDDASGGSRISGNQQLRLGQFSGKRKVVSPVREEPDSKSNLDPKAKSKLGTFRGTKQSKDIPMEAQIEQQHTLATNRSRLGVFHGRGGDQGSSMVRTEGQETSDSLGKEVKAKDSWSPSRKTVEQSTGSVKTQEVDQKEEALDESADQKRERLKRQLEEKAKAPIKKKRKF